MYYDALISMVNMANKLLSAIITLLLLPICLQVTEVQPTRSEEPQEGQKSVSTHSSEPAGGEQPN